MLIAVSFLTCSKSKPILAINSGSQSSGYRISKKMYLSITDYIREGIPDKVIASSVLITKKYIS